MSRRDEALREWSRVEDELATAVAVHRETFFAIFPEGRYARYRHGESEVGVFVVRHHDYLERLLVRGQFSDREYWVDGARMVIR